MGTGELLPPWTEECELTADSLKEAIRLQPQYMNRLLMSRPRFASG